MYRNLNNLSQGESRLIAEGLKLLLNTQGGTELATLMADLQNPALRPPARRAIQSEIDRIKQANEDLIDLLNFFDSQAAGLEANQGG